MIIRKLIVRGDTYQRTLKFSSGLNIIRGEKTSGKSLVLSLIDYCLGKSKGISLKVQTELDENVNQIFLELEIGNEIVTIVRGIKKEITRFWIYHCEVQSIEEYIPEKLTKKTLQSFLMNKLGAIEFTKTKNKPRSNKLTTETVSFRDMYRYCFVNQHELGTHNFLANNEVMKRYKNPIAFEMIFDLIDFSQNILQTKVAKTKNTIEDYKKNEENLNGYLIQRGNNDLFDVLDQIDQLNDQIAKLQKRKADIVNKQSQNKELIGNNRDYALLSQEIRELDKDIQSMKSQISDIELGISSNETLMNDYQLEMEDIKTTEEINYKLKIDKHELTCPLCNSKIKNDFHLETIGKKTQQNFAYIIKDISTKIDIIKKVIKTSNNKISELKKEISKKRKKRTILLLALNEFSKDVQVPFLPELNSINVSINSYEKNREVLVESKRVFNKIDEIKKSISVEENNLEKLKNQLKNLDDKTKRKDKIMGSLNKRYKENMTKMKYKEMSHTFIDSEKYIPYYKNASVYEHDSGGLLECMQISYLEAIVSNEDALYHPKVLLLDSISKYFGTNDNQEVPKEEKIKDPEVYMNMYSMLQKMSLSAQVIIIENTPPIEFLKYVSYTFRSGERGLIDLDKNEFLSD